MLKKYEEQDIDVSIINPGEELRKILCRAFPFDENEKSSNIGRLDKAFKTDGEFARYVYESSITHLLRRLITSAKYVKKQCEKEGKEGDEGYLEVSIRKFLRKNFDLPSNKIEPILTFLVLSIRLKRKNTSEPMRYKLRYPDTGRPITKCYICGGDLDFSNPNSDAFAEVEHVWPLAFGGQNREFNYKYACHKCNKVKEHLIDAYDFHYELTCLSSDKSDDNYSTQMHLENKMALWAKSNFTCARCHAPAQSVGELQLSRKETDDSWHFFNIEAHCDRHATE